jgi:predicted GTPase
VVYAGVDYGDILARAEREADIILWDGGNNDLPFYRPSLWITLADPHRAGHEPRYHPGEANFRSADVILINKADTAPEGGVDVIRRNAAAVNPGAKVIAAASRVTAEHPELIRGSGFSSSRTARLSPTERCPTERGRSLPISTEPQRSWIRDLTPWAR